MAFPPQVLEEFKEVLKEESPSNKTTSDKTKENIKSMQIRTLIIMSILSNACNYMFIDLLGYTLKCICIHHHV